MPTLLGTIMRGATRKKGEPLNILTFPTHERYETGLAKTGHNFFAYRGKGIKDWDTTYAPLPANYTLLPPEKELPIDIDIDIVLSQNKFGQFPIANYFAKRYHAPLISLEHTLPFKGWSKEQVNELCQMRGDANVFISEYSIKQWGYNPFESVVIHHGVDTEVFKPKGFARKQQLLSVVNDWINRDWCCGFKIWKEITKDLPVQPVGKTPGLSQPAKDVNELVEFYNTSQVFLNTSLISPVPTALLEAMSCGCAIVTTATCMIPEIIINGVNGFASNNPAELKDFCKTLLDNPKLADKLGKAARKTIEQKFSMDKFVKEWDGLFTYIAENIYFKG